MEPETSFRWASPLGVSVLLFLVYGGFYVLVGILAPVANMRDAMGDRFIFMGPAAGEARFGEPPPKIMAEQPVVREVRDTLLLALSSLMFTAGVLIVSLAWFGLRAGQAWALIPLAVAAVGAFPHYALILAPYFRAGAPIISSLPPFITLPAVIVGPATALGWWALR